MAIRGGAALTFISDGFDVRSPGGRGVGDAVVGGHRRWATGGLRDGGCVRGSGSLGSTSSIVGGRRCVALSRRAPLRCVMCSRIQGGTPSVADATSSMGSLPQLKTVVASSLQLTHTLDIRKRLCNLLQLHERCSRARACRHGTPTAPPWYQVSSQLI